MFLVPHRLFLWIALVFGSIFLFANQPFYGPDEVHHFTRVVALAEGHWLSDGYAPSSYQDFINIYLHPHTYNPFTVVLPPSKGDIIFNHFNRATVYSPAPYLSVIPVVWLALHVNATPQITFFLARFIIFITSTILIYYTIRMTPVLKWPLFFIALYPATTFIRSCLNADPITLGYAFLFIALIMRKAYSEKAIKNKDILRLSVVSFLLCMSKTIYFLIPFMFFLLPRKQFISYKHYIVAMLTIIALPLLLDVIWYITSAHAYGDLPHGQEINTQLPTGVNPTAQFLFCVTHPFALLNAVWHSWVDNPSLFKEQFLGGRNARETIQPVGFIYPAIILLFLLPGCAPAETLIIQRSKRMWCMVIFILSLMLVYLSMYVAWTPVGATTVDGIQGRYFAPFLPLLFLATAHRVSKEFYPLIVKFTVFFTLVMLIDGLRILRFHEYPG